MASLLHVEVLNSGRQELLKNLNFIKEADFYLAGGTALALQIGHRKSVDFDFYTPKMFEPSAFWARFNKAVAASENVRMADGTLIVLVKKEIELSFFFYDYPLLEPLVSCEPLLLASLKDIAAMKIVAVEQRGIRRDFVDLYFLAKKFGLYEIIVATLEKYSGHNVYPILQALCYFEDADKEPDRPLSLIKPAPWIEIKKFFLQEVGRVQKLF
ncbi:MAG: nucleotidyl transferase AbiEii/AbiGii toxin family protein [Deltaproteobacteria bacterium]|nr:nucleotidyl transferase AbiEii/AbiGii toxin family protein [Deltaproteobacteria bacterium]